ncbi:menaquinone via futalosine step 1 [Campylobacter insulaenigrae]|uniref:Chorismate dehydratase n=1 Tax=Campylobacter insulaenigrae TaxID=260714 RepID=A0ABY3G6F4_9BACT|nr:MqnA/MqnD/SBP family protein [Campylobacter insulaenigrae]MCR6570898.1 menaquinone via futalosine step 1 [Campylobacter insulaenigrae]MCR6572443.1 menaquinone via futalosine step 1 [Campylobacter insulaenigrae]MCR6574111.1 menaquinone via futalosine step 1 [Campylobacter insulaenigrae]MCR6575134.1 menaquinone via futalosine step 1 [Campylobacter insulaenigrae]MCR6577163.1 menaquinone via futalosine step 1 [Campylobacter insulaenigrae]
MIFGKIDYLNLLPLHIYLKKMPLPTYVKKITEYKKGVPKKLNESLYFRRIDAAIISSIESYNKKYKTLNIGICANKKVKSVLVKKQTQNKEDSSSATSNALAKILKQNGEVIIGDKALKLYLQNPNAYIDLCEVWYEKLKLPFVFARFSCIKNFSNYKKIMNCFVKRKIFIPQYILCDYAKSRKLSQREIKNYLKLIYYKIDTKEQLALKKFYIMQKELRIKNKKN